MMFPYLQFDFKDLHLVLIRHKFTPVFRGGPNIRPVQLIRRVQTGPNWSQLVPIGPYWSHWLHPALPINTNNDGGKAAILSTGVPDQGGLHGHTQVFTLRGVARDLK